MKNQEITKIFKQEFLKKIQRANANFEDDFTSEPDYIEFYIGQTMQDVLKELDIDKNRREEIEQDIKDQVGYDMSRDAVAEINDIISANYKNLPKSSDRSHRIFYKAFEEAKKEEGNPALFLKFVSIVHKNQKIVTWYIEQNDRKQWHEGKESIAYLCLDYLENF
jgi:hypothetical protein